MMYLTNYNMLKSLNQVWFYNLKCQFPLNSLLFLNKHIYSFCKFSYSLILTILTWRLPDGRLLNLWTLHAKAIFFWTNILQDENSFKWMVFISDAPDLCKYWKRKVYQNCQWTKLPKIKPYISIYGLIQHALPLPHKVSEVLHYWIKTFC